MRTLCEDKGSDNFEDKPFADFSLNQKLENFKMRVYYKIFAKNVCSPECIS